MPVVVRGLEVLENPPDKAAQLLLDYPAAPYTAFLVSETGSTLCFEQHCLRLKKGLQALASQSRPTCEVEQLGQLLRPVVRPLHFTPFVNNAFR